MSRHVLKPSTSNRDPGPWKDLSCENGIRLVEAADFHTFFQFVHAGFGDFDTAYLWRGQRSASWEITSNLARSKKAPYSHIQDFRNAVARCTNAEYDISNDNPHAEKEKLRLWALGQHHGLLTPLIDWTAYPFVALFFAFVERPQEGDDNFRAVFALNTQEVGSINFEIAETKGIQPFREKLSSPPYSEEFKDYLAKEFGMLDERSTKMLKESRIPAEVRDRMLNREYEHFKKKQLHRYRSRASENRRLHSQGGWHTYTEGDTSVEGWIRANIALQVHNLPVLTKIQIPTNERTVILRGLNKMNINYLSLFPDLEGAAKHCNLALHEAEFIGDVRGY